MLSTWALLLAGDLNLRGQAVWHEAWLITAGGLVQTMVAIAAWPLRPFAAERRAVADAYRALAAYARAPTTPALQSTAAALAAADRDRRCGLCAARGARRAAHAGRTRRMGPAGTGGAGPIARAGRRRDPASGCEHLGRPRGKTQVRRPRSGLSGAAHNGSTSRSRAAVQRAWSVGSQPRAPRAASARRARSRRGTRSARCAESSRCAPARFVTQRGSRSR